MLKKGLSILLTAMMLAGVLTVAPLSTAAEETDTWETVSDDTQAGDLGALEEYERVEVDSSSLKFQETDKDGEAVGAAEEEQIPPTTEAETTPAYAEGEAIVVFKDEMDLGAIEDEVTVEDTIKQEGAGDGQETNMAVVSDDSRTTDEIIESLQDNDNVAYVLPNRYYHTTALTNDTYSKYQWALENTGQYGGTAGVDTNPENLWSKAASTGKECVVAVLDTGIDLAHSDLKSVLWKNTYSSSQLPGSGNYGYDCTGTYSDGRPQDTDGHGSHVAGIIAAAANNNLGISGINKANVKIMMLKIEDSNGHMKDSYIKKAFEYVIKAKKLGVNIKAVNCSFGGYGDDADLSYYNDTFNTLGGLGVVSCIAAGNENENIDQKNYEDGYYYWTTPAATTSKYALTVGAADEKGRKASFSCYGKTNVDIAAPGVAILSTVRDYTFEPSIYTSTQRSNLCAYYNSFDSSFTPLGGSNASVYLTSSVYFGTGGKSLAVKVPGGKTTKIGISYTRDSASADYYLNMKIKGTDDCYVTFYDTAKEDTKLTGKLFGYYQDESWYVENYKVSPSALSSYTKSKNREFYFSITSEAPTGSYSYFYLDDFAVSKANVSGSQLGDYQFMRGTSMASPYVAGAVALAANAYPSATATQLVSAVKSSARTISSLNGYVASSRFLDLKNLSISPSTVAVTGISLDKSSASVKVGKSFSLNASITPSNATDKSVTWSVTNPSGKTVASISASGSTCTVTGKAEGTATITAKSSNGKTATCKVTVTKALTVSTPSISSMTSGKKGITIKWSAVSGASGYQLLWKGSSGWIVLKTIYSGTSCVDTAVKYGRKETYSLRAIDSSGDPVSSYSTSGWSHTYGVTTPKISSLTSSEKGITIKWNSVADCTTYRVYYKTSSGGWKRFSKDVTGTSMIDAAVSYGRAETYTVRAVNDNGDVCSDYVAAGTTTTFGVATPKITSTATTSSGVLIKWSSVTGATTYRVYYKGRSGWKSMADVKGTSYTDADVRYGGTYTYTVRAVTPDGSKAISGYDSVGTTHTHYIPTPSVTGLESLAKGVKITWKAVSGAAKYRVFYKSSKGWVSMGETTAAYFVDEDVRAGRTYLYTVRCISDDLKTYTSDFNHDGWRYTYNPRYATPVIQRYNTNAKGTAVFWDAVPGIKYYRVYYRTESGSWTKLADTQNTFYRQNDISYGSSYYYTVRCMTHNCKDFASDYQSTGLITYWSTPSITSASYNAGKLHFTISDFHTSKRYSIFRWTGSAWKAVGILSSKNGYLDVGTDFKAGKSYKFTVIAVNEDGSVNSYYDDAGFTFTV